MARTVREIKEERFSVGVAIRQIIEEGKHADWKYIFSVAYIMGGWVLVLNLFSIITGIPLD